MALHLSVGVSVDKRGLRAGMPEPLGEQGQGHAGLVEVHGPRVAEHVRVNPVRDVGAPGPGGSGVLATELGKALADKGHTIHFITYQQPVRLSSFHANIFYHEVRVPTYPLFDYPPYETALASTMVDVVLNNNVELLHVHYAIPHASAAYMAKQILAKQGKRIPVITTLHGTDITLVGRDKTYSPVVTFSMEESDILTAVSDNLKEETYKNFTIEKDIEVIHNFVDVNRFHRKPVDAFKQLIAPKGERISVHASNFRKVKRVDDVINVAGHRLGTAEIESALVAHPKVAEAAVVGYPHEIKGQGIYAYVTLMVSETPSDELRRELVAWVRQEISPIAAPDLLQWAPGLPKTRSGKIMRRILRKIAANEHDALGDVTTLAEPGVVDELVDNRMNRAL